MNQIFILVTIVLINSALCILFFSYQNKIYLSVSHWIILILGAFILSTLGLFFSSLVINRFRISRDSLKLIIDFTLSFLTMLVFSYIFIKTNQVQD